MTSRATHAMASAKASAHPTTPATTSPAIAEAITSHPKGVTMPHAAST